MSCCSGLSLPCWATSASAAFDRFSWKACLTVRVKLQCTSVPCRYVVLICAVLSLAVLCSSPRPGLLQQK